MNENELQRYWDLLKPYADVSKIPDDLAVIDVRKLIAELKRLNEERQKEIEFLNEAQPLAEKLIKQNQRYKQALEKIASSNLEGLPYQSSSSKVAQKALKGDQ
jgi:hypothetical protein